MQPVLIFAAFLLCSFLVSWPLADANPNPNSPPTTNPPPATPPTPNTNPTPTANQHTPAAQPTANIPPSQSPASPSPPPPASASASASAAAGGGASATPSVHVAEHQHQKIEADLSHLNSLVSANAEKIRQVFEEVNHLKVSVSTAVSSSVLDALKLDVKNSIDSLSSKAADSNAKISADNAQAARSAEEKLATFSSHFQQLESKFLQLESKLLQLEKNTKKIAEDTKVELLQIDAKFGTALHALHVEFNATLATAAKGFDFKFDWDTIWSTIVSKSKAAAEKIGQLSVQLYERANKEFATFRAESIPTREEAEKLVKEWWENAQQFYWNTAQPAAIDLYHTARHYFDDATEQITDLLAEKASVPKETARLIALSFLALTAGVLAFVVFVIVLQIVSFVLSIVFYFLCCRFCCANKNKNKSKKEKKLSAAPANNANAAAASASASSSSAQAAKAANSAPPSVKKDKGIVKNSPFLNKTQAQ